MPARGSASVTLVARREPRLRELAGELEGEHGVRAEAIAADLGSEAERERPAATLGERGLTVEILSSTPASATHTRFMPPSANGWWRWCASL